METDPEQGGQPEIDPVRDQIDDPWVALRRRIRIESNIPIIGRGSVNDLQQAAEKFLHPHQLQTGALSYTLGCVLKDSDMHEATYLRQSNEHARFVLEGVEGDYAP